MRTRVAGLLMALLLPLLLTACGEDTTKTDTAKADAVSSPDAMLKMLKSKGIKVVGKFDSGTDLQGYAVTANGRPLTVYLLPDGKHAIIGAMLDQQGNNLSAKPLQELVLKPMWQQAWGQLEKASWVADGSADAERIIYMFGDANCHYCHQFWTMTRPWVEAGEVQVRHIMVAILSKSSLTKAATILAADDPSAALTKNETNFDEGGITPLEEVPQEWLNKVKANTKLLASFGLHSTPSIFYRNADGEVRLVKGAPQDDDKLAAIMGSDKPAEPSDAAE